MLCVIENKNGVYDEKNNEIESAPHPMMTIKIPCDRPVKKGSLLRMKAD